MHAREGIRMAVTVQQIADATGVSRGTVDRALNNRGRVDPEVAERIRRTAEEMGYVKKPRKTNGKRKSCRIGILYRFARYRTASVHRIPRRIMVIFTASPEAPQEKQ